MVVILQKVCPTNMKEINLTSGDLVRARKYAENMGVLNKSFTKGKGNLVGQLGEIAACRYFGSVYGESTYQYDLVFNNMRIDVKTRGCTSKPREHYLVGVSTVTRRQNCDIYVFARVLTTNYSTAWLLGWTGREEFYDLATFFAKGQIDPTGGGVFKFAEDGYQMPISELHRMPVLRESAYSKISEGRILIPRG